MRQYIIDARREWPEAAKKIVGDTIKVVRDKVRHADVKKEALLRNKEVVNFVRDSLKNERGGAVYYKIDKNGVRLLCGPSVLRLTDPIDPRWSDAVDVHHQYCS
jgi:hypothetical protein